MLKDFFKRLFCRHKHTNFIRNIYGDEINREAGYKVLYRSWWKCRDCDEFVKKEEYVD